MKRIPIAPLILTLSLTFWGSQNAHPSHEPPRTWRTYSDPDYGFAFKYPGDDVLELRITDGLDSLVQRIRGACGTAPYHLENQQREIVIEGPIPFVRVTIYANPRQLDLKAFARLMLQEYRIKEADISVARVEIDDASGIKATFPGAGCCDKVSKVYLSRGDHVIVISFSGTGDTKEETEFLDSFSFSKR